MSDHWLDALAYTMRPKEPRHLRGWRKAWSWLRSRPLDRVRRNMATQHRVREDRREVDAYFDRYRGENWGESR